MDLDEGRPKLFPVEALSPSRYLYHISSLVDNSQYHSKHWYNPGIVAFQETYSRLSKFTGTALLRCACRSNSNMHSKRSDFSGQTVNISSTQHDLPRFSINYRRKALEIPEFLQKFSRFAVNQLLGKAKDLQFIAAISLAGNLVPPLNNT